MRRERAITQRRGVTVRVGLNFNPQPDVSNLLTLLLPLEGLSRFILVSGNPEAPGTKQCVPRPDCAVQPGVPS